MFEQGCRILADGRHQTAVVPPGEALRIAGHLSRRGIELPRQRHLVENVIVDDPFFPERLECVQVQGQPDVDVFALHHGFLVYCLAVPRA